MHHIQGVKNECADYISRNTFDDLIRARSESLAKEAFSRMDVHLDLNMTMIRPLDGLQKAEYVKEFGDIYKRLEKRLEPLLVNQKQWKRDKSYLWQEDRTVVPSDRFPALLKSTHESSCHVGADRTEAGSDPRGHLGVTWGVYLCAGKPPLADIILSHPPDLTRCDSVIGLAIPAMSGHIQYRGAASGNLYIRISGINRVLSS